MTKYNEEDIKRFLDKNDINELSLTDIPGVELLQELTSKANEQKINIENFLKLLSSVVENSSESDDQCLEDTINELMWEYAYETGQEFDGSEFCTPSIC